MLRIENLKGKHDFPNELNNLLEPRINIIDSLLEPYKSLNNDNINIILQTWDVIKKSQPSNDEFSVDTFNTILDLLKKCNIITSEQSVGASTKVIMYVSPYIQQGIMQNVGNVAIFKNEHIQRGNLISLCKTHLFFDMFILLALLWHNKDNDNAVGMLLDKIVTQFKIYIDILLATTYTATEADFNKIAALADLIRTNLQRKSFNLQKGIEDVINFDPLHLLSDGISSAIVHSNIENVWTKAIQTRVEALLESLINVNKSNKIKLATIDRSYEINLQSGVQIFSKLRVKSPSQAKLRDLVSGSLNKQDFKGRLSLWLIYILAIIFSGFPSKEQQIHPSKPIIKMLETVCDIFSISRESI